MTALPFDQLTQKAQNMFLYGDHPVDGKPTPKFQKTGFPVFSPYLNESRGVTSDRYRESLMEHMSATPAPSATDAACALKAGRQSPQHVHPDFTALPSLRSRNREHIILKGRTKSSPAVIHEIRERLNFECAVGLTT